MRKLNASIVIGLIVAFIGATTVYAYGRSVDRRAQQGQQMVPVLVATAPLTAGMSVADLKSKVHQDEVPQAYLVSEALSSLDQAPGSAVLTGDVPKGGQLSRSSFGDPAAAGRLNPAEGKVAVAVQTDISAGVARYLDTGSLVDVFVTYRSVSDASGRSTRVANRTKLFASGVKVLAVSVAPQPGDKSSGTRMLATQQTSDKVIAVLELSPRDAERVVNATTLGSIYFGYTTRGGDSTSTGVVPDDVVAVTR